MFTISHFLHTLEALRLLVYFFERSLTPRSSKDFDDLESLTTTLIGQDAVISTVASSAVSGQKLLIDAAVQCGAKRFIPSEFGCDLKNPKTRNLPVCASKVEIEEYLQEVVEKHQTFSYTLIYNGPLLDWGLKMGMFFNFKERKAEIYDGGEQLISTTRLAVVGKAVRRVLTHPHETADRAVWVKDIDVTQNDLLKLAQSLTPGDDWEIKEVNTEDLAKASIEELQKTEIGRSSMLGFIRRAIFAPGYGSFFERSHNSVLGIKGMTQPDLEELMTSIFGTGKL